jgi:hypothetical protein
VQDDNIPVRPETGLSEDPRTKDGSIGFIDGR